MKAITIIQPWATLIALGEKRFETRSRRTNYRGDLAIHAGKKVNKEICKKEPFRSILAKHGYTADNLPTGAIIAKGQLVECFSSTNDDGSSAQLEAYFHYNVTVSGNEYAFGWFAPGRFAYELADVTPIEPIPAKGQLGLWNYPFELEE